MSRYQAVIIGQPGRLDFAHVSEFAYTKGAIWTGQFVTSDNVSDVPENVTCTLYQYVTTDDGSILTYQFNGARFAVKGDTVKFSADTRIRI